MSMLINLTLKKVLYWLTNRKSPPPQYIRLWYILGFGVLLMFFIGDAAESVLITMASIVVGVLLIVLTLIYLIWEIDRQTRFQMFKKDTRKKDDPFETTLLPSDRVLKPENNKRAG